VLFRSQTMNVEVDDRTQHEIYMPVFKAAFDAGAGAVMCSYNSVYGQHACENKKLLKKLLREDLGFKGFVVSDWGATHDAVNSVRGGLDVEMPEGEHFQKIGDAMGANPDLEKEIQQMAVHVLSAMYYVGQFDGRFPIKGQLPLYGALDADATSEAHRAVALQTILDSAVLLRNQDGALPVKTKGKKIAMIGRFCDAVQDPSYKQGSVWSGGGSGFVDTHRVITPLAGVKAEITDAASVVFSPDASAAKGADVAVLCVAAHGEEGWDRANDALPEVWDLIKGVRKQNSNAKVVVFAAVPGAVEMEWVKEADAVVLLFMPGEQVGPAFAKLLNGAASPSGRLPVSFPKADEKRFTKQQYPGICPNVEGGWCEHLQANFSEGPLIGYRWNEAKGVPPAFPFGFGLTYTEFNFSGFRAKCKGEDATVSFNISNVGARDGAAVPQVYIGFPSLKPVLKQLRGFKKVQVKAKSEVSVSFSFTQADWSYYDEKVQGWVSAWEKGEDITLSVGSSSTEIFWRKKLSCGGSTAIVRRELA